MPACCAGGTYCCMFGATLGTWAGFWPEKGLLGAFVAFGGGYYAGTPADFLYYFWRSTGVVEAEVETCLTLRVFVGFGVLEAGPVYYCDIFV